VDKNQNNSLVDAKATWERLAQEDPLWAVLTDPAKSGHRWNQEEFFETGRREITILFQHLRSIGLATGCHRVLDFGCGVGRLTQAFAEKCEEVHGVDISEAMIAQAKHYNRFPEKCQYHVNSVPNLELFADDSFDLIYTSIVLQHVPTDFINRYLTEFVRLVSPQGVLIFQLPEVFKSMPRSNLLFSARVRNMIRLRTRLKRCLKACGLLKITDSSLPVMHMNCLPEEQVRNVIERLGAAVVDVQLTNSTDLAFNGNLRFLTEEPEQGWVSKQYCVKKAREI
jgi:2-polyprenyl-3-methyl-5-hydroxy-6-metoxy-1,4-benzoquinol methylase